jgi:hypothetical protein
MDREHQRARRGGAATIVKGAVGKELDRPGRRSRTWPVAERPVLRLAHDRLDTPVHHDLQDGAPVASPAARCIAVKARRTEYAVTVTGSAALRPPHRRDGRVGPYREVHLSR